METELKLSVARPRRVARLLRELDGERLGRFRPAGPPHRVVLVDRYLDTAEPGGRLPGRLSERLLRARLRRRGASTTLTVKRPGTTSAAGVTARVELEGPATSSLDPNRWPPSDARSALLEAIGVRPLVEVGRLRQDRLVRVVRGEDAEIELSLDRVDALLEGRVVARRYELEAELKHGPESALESLAAELARLPGLGPAAGSKLAFAIEARRVGSANSRLLDSRPR